MGRHVETGTIEATNDCVAGVAQAGCAGSNGIEHWLNIRRRAGDDTQDLTGGCLLLQRVGEVAIADLEFVEQAGILNGDGCLVRESLEQGHVRLRKWSEVGMPNCNRTDRIAPSQHRHRKHVSETCLFDHIAKDLFGRGGMGHVLGIVRYIGNIDYRAIENCSCCEQMSARSSRKKLQRSLQGNRWVVVMSDHVDELAVESVHRTKESTTQFHRMLRDRIKHGLQIRDRKSTRL